MERSRSAGVGPGDPCTIASAFAPAHVTGIFRPASRGRDPRERGSLGAGIVLELGVRATAELRPSDRPRRIVTSDLGRPLPISEDVARRLFSDRIGTLRVRLTHELPVGQGFGMSAAGAAATALAVAPLVGASRARAFEIAHLADLFGGGGLGGVAAIAGGGGLEFRERPGVPPWGRVRHRALEGTVLVGVVGRPIPSPRVLTSASALRRIDRASGALDGLLRRPTSTGFFAASETFTDRAGLSPPSLTRLLRALRRRDAWAAQAMFGRTFFARPRSAGARTAVLDVLRRAGVPTLEVGASSGGARSLGTRGPRAQPF